MTFPFVEGLSFLYKTKGGEEMKKFISMLLALTMLLCGCGNEAAPATPEMTEMQVTLSAADFADGNHKRSESYMAAFKTKTVIIDGLTINIAENVYDDASSPKLAEEIARSFYALRAYAPELAADTEIYVVSITTTGGPVLLGSRLYITDANAKNGEYLPWLASGIYGIDEWWRCVGLGLAASGEKTDNAALLESMESYFAMAGESHILSLHPCYFLEEFADASTRAIVRQMSHSLTEYIISEQGFAVFREDGGEAFYKRAWLEHMGISHDLSWLDSEPATRLDKMEFSETERIPMILGEADLRLNMESVDWIPDAESTYRFLLDFAGQLTALYARFETEAPEFYAMLQEDESITDVNFRDSDYPLSSRASMLKAEALVSDDADVLHEIVHTFMPRANIEEAYWLCEGLVTYLTAPLVPYFADSIVVDSVMREYEGDTEEVIVFRAETVNCFEKLNGFGISTDMASPIYKVYEAAGYAAFLNPDNTSTPVATQSIKDNYADRHAYNLKTDYPGNELSYCQSMVFVDWLVEKYGLERLIFAETDAGSYFELFPDAAAFEAEFIEFWEERVVPLAE